MKTIALVPALFALILGCSDSKFKGGAQTAKAPAAQDAKPADPEPPTDDTPTPNQPDDTLAEFGEVEVYRIGDGSSGDESACVSELANYNLKGTIYYFPFEVTENNTEISIAIGKLCGVDAKLTWLSLINQDTKADVQAEAIVPTDKSGTRASPYVPISGKVLSKGKYALKIRAAHELGKPNEAVGTIAPGVDNYDDFIVGKITVQGSKPVVAGQVYTE